jgi:hypothetical protein
MYEAPQSAETQITPQRNTDALTLFRPASGDLDPRFTPIFVQAGAAHLILVLRSREKRAAMPYDLPSRRGLILNHTLLTIALNEVQSDPLFHMPTAFASGGELDASAIAALAEYRRDTGWPDGGVITLTKGADTGGEIQLQGGNS